MKLTLTDEILLSLLAKRDCIFAPVRTFIPGSFLGANSSQGRQAYRASGGGIEWASGAASASKRVQSQRAIESLANEGLIDPIKSGGRTTKIRLTFEGELYAQALAALPSLIEDWGWAIFEAVKRRNGFSVWEDDLIPAWRKSLDPIGEWDRKGCLLHILDCAAPFLCRDWLFCGSTYRMNARYLPGEKANEAVRPTDVEYPDVGDLDWEIARDFYLKEYNVAHGALCTTPPAIPNQLGEIPFTQSACSAEEIAAWERSAELAAQGL